ncbi:MAG: alpha-hydroxy-acid oxidizing protein [Nitratireductor sp.]|nr:alpha-hydroxy-acid oxidizing protein [Nitratireductor sp.]
MTRLPLEGYRESCDTTTILGGGRGIVEKPIELKIPIYIASMSFGALSASAKAGHGHGASKVGTMTCTGEGGIRSGVDAAKCLALGANAVMIGNAAMMALGCNSPRYLEDYQKLGTSPGACHHCHTGMCPVGVATQTPELEARMDPHAGAERVARYLTAMTMEITALAKACGKSSVHNLEVEDLRAMSFEASAFTGVKMAGIERPFEW